MHVSGDLRSAWFGAALFALAAAGVLSLLVGSRKVVQPLPPAASALVVEASPVTLAFAALSEPGLQVPRVIKVIPVDRIEAASDTTGPKADKLRTGHLADAAPELLLSPEDQRPVKPHLFYRDLPRADPPSLYSRPRDEERPRDVCGRSGGKRVDYGRRWRCVYAHGRHHRRHG